MNNYDNWASDSTQSQIMEELTMGKHGSKLIGEWQCTPNIFTSLIYMDPSHNGLLWWVFVITKSPGYETLRSSMLPGHYSKENSISVHQVLTTYVASHFSWTVFNTLSWTLWVSYSWHTPAVEYASYHPPTLSTKFLLSSISRPYSYFKSHGLFSQQLQNTFTISKV